MSSPATIITAEDADVDVDVESSISSTAVATTSIMPTAVSSSSPTTTAKSSIEKNTFMKQSHYQEEDTRNSYEYESSSSSYYGTIPIIQGETIPIVATTTPPLVQEATTVTTAQQPFLKNEQQRQRNYEDEDDYYYRQGQRRSQICKCFGCFCCDMRYAVILINTVMLVFLGIALVVSNNDNDNERTHIVMVEMILVAFGIYGAITFSKTKYLYGPILLYGYYVINGLFWTNNIPFIIMGILFIYPHIVLLYEIQNDIITQETYPYESYCCCCC